jgi:NADPH:quinone reductase
MLPFQYFPMNAIVITQPGAPNVLQVKEYPTPVPGPGEVLIQVKAAGLNRADIFQRKGHYPAPPGVPADIPGLEVAGIVAACGPDVVLWKPGDAVCALLAGGGYAEYVGVKEGQCLPVPNGWSFIEAASLPEAVFTVWSNVFERGALQPEETLLVHGGSSGIGTMAIQMAKAWGCKVVVTVGNAEKGNNCLQLGADQFINYKTADFEAALKEEGVDVILDMVGGDYVAKNINILKPEGRLVYINTTGGGTAPVDIRQVMHKRLTLTGSTLRSRAYDYKQRLAQAVQQHVWPMIAAGRLRPVIYKTFPFAEVAAAHQLLESSEHTGKIVLEW